MQDAQRKIFLSELKAYGLQHNIPNISEKNAEFLRGCIQKNNTQTLLEIGTANGYSSIQFACELEKTGGKLHSIEFSQEMYEQAQENIKKLGLQETIVQYFGDAREIIPFIEISFDMVFIDGLKRATLDFYLLVKEKVSPGGIIVIDDVILYKHKMENFYAYLDKHKISYEVIPVDDDDGVMIIKNEIPKSNLL